MRNKIQTILIGIGLLWGPILANSATINAINVGSSANDGTGDTLRAAFQKVNANEAALNADKLEHTGGTATNLILAGTFDASSATTITGIDTSDEVAETVTNGKAHVWFPGGSGQQLSVNHDVALNFSDTVNSDDLPFTIAMWVKSGEWSQTNSTRALISKFNSNRGWRITYYGDDLNVWKGDGTDVPRRRADNVMTGYNDKWVHLVFVFPGCGPNSDDDFTVPLDNFKFYRNGEDVTTSFAATTNLGSYGGFANGGGADTSKFNIANQGDGTARAANLSVRNTEIFNTALSAADVETIYRSGVPFELDQASATEIDTSDFSAGVDSWQAGGAGSPAVAGNIDSIGGQNDNLRVTNGSTSGSIYAFKTGLGMTPGKRVRFSCDFYVPSTNSDIDGVGLYQNDGSLIVANDSPSTDTWTRISGEFAVTATTSPVQGLRINGLDAGSTTVTDAGSDDVLYIRNVVVKEAGAILDLDIGATDFSAVSDNIPDRSGNSFEGTLNSMSEANGVGFPTGLYINNPSPSANQNLIVAENAGTQVFAIDEDGDLTIASDLIITNSSTPASASATGTAGTIAWDANYIYICTAANTWKRVAISTW